MKTLTKSIFYFFIATFFLSCVDDKPIILADFEVVPLPQNIAKTNGVFVLKSNTQIVYPKGNEIQKQTAKFLAEYIKSSTGFTLKITDIKTPDNAIVLRNDYKEKKAESYNLTVDNRLIVINGSDEAGTFYGIQTLRKSIPADATRNTIEFPATEIKDYPRFGYRGMHLDVSRHFFPVKFIKEYIDILALHNINQFHWHLTDDQGWRVEIKKYPNLTKIGSVRSQTVVGRNNDSNFDHTSYGGFYTQDEIRDVVDYAKKRFITVVPEIDLPGHMLAALASYPHLGCTGGPYEVGQKWGIFTDVLCAGNDSTYTFLDDVFAEIVDLFPSKYIHVGGDECPKIRWESCPKCQAKIEVLGIKANAKYSAENQLQSYMISHVEKFLNGKGRQIIGWDEILEGGLAPNATVMSWRGIEGGIAAAKLRHNAIMTPHTFLYFDYGQTTTPENEPLAMGSGNTPEHVYSYEPVPAKSKAKVKKHIIGVQANLWTEYIADSKHAEEMLLPRIGALAEIQWTMPEKKDYKTFEPRLINLMKLYDRLGYNYAKYLLENKANGKAVDGIK